MRPGIESQVTSALDRGGGLHITEAYTCLTDAGGLLARAATEAEDGPEGAGVADELTRLGEEADAIGETLLALRRMVRGLGERVRGL